MFKAHLLDPNRNSAKRISFELFDGATAIKSGTLLRLNFKPYALSDCKSLNYCKAHGGVDWTVVDKFCSLWDDTLAEKTNALPSYPAYIVVSESGVNQLRVSTVSQPTSELVFEKWGAHPVSGNREFGWSKAPERPTQTLSYFTRSEQIDIVDCNPFGTQSVKRPPLATCFVWLKSFWRELFDEFTAKDHSERRASPVEPSYTKNPKMGRRPEKQILRPGSGRQDSLGAINRINKIWMFDMPLN